MNCLKCNNKIKLQDIKKWIQDNEVRMTAKCPKCGLLSIVQPEEYIKQEMKYIFGDVSE